MADKSLPTPDNPEPGPRGEANSEEPVSPDEALAALRSEGVLAPPPQQIHTPPPLEGRMLGQYRVLEKIGQGGMGAVFRAEDTKLNRIVALKIIHCGPLDDIKTAQRFQREAMCLARLSHPNLLHVYNVGSEDEWHYFAMELLEGTTLSQFLRLNKRLAVDDLFPLVGQILSALHYIHLQGITHRDIKCGNIMICGERAVLMDFGLAKDEQHTGLTSVGSVLGTPEYMAPEQAEGNSHGPPTDIYSMGVVMYEALAGKVPYHGRSAMAVIRKHLDEKPPDIRETFPDASPRLAETIRCCLAKSPAERYRDCSALAVDLVQIHSTTELKKLAAADRALETAIHEAAVGVTAPGSRIGEDSGPATANTQATLSVGSEQARADPLTKAPNQDSQRPAWLYAVLGFAAVSILWLLAWAVWPGSGKDRDKWDGQPLRVEGSDEEFSLIGFKPDGDGDPAKWIYEIRWRDGKTEKISDTEFRERFGKSPTLLFDAREGGRP